MKILSMTYTDSEQEWGYEQIKFFGLTLLVGVSGVGKTQILKSINTLRQVADGDSVNGIQWEIEFSTLKGSNYVWSGSFENVKSVNDSTLELFDMDDDKEKVKPKIIYEILRMNGKIIVKRDGQEFLFNDAKMPKLSFTESALSILKEEELIKEAYNSFKLIILRDHTQKEGLRFGPATIEKLKAKYKSFEQIKESDQDTFTKLIIVSEVSPRVFGSIKESFIEIFPQVENIRVEPLKDDNMSPYLFEALVIQIKERGVNKWIPHNQMSSGMLRTLLHISEMFLWNEGTVILIDEFENSLGVNCIDILTEDLVFGDNKIQFIATSHHPYIINKIPYEYWKIVTRKGGKIKTFDAKDFDLGKSHHDRFMSLINHPFYKEGISS